jgi:ADP-ribosylation factor related protein 1
MFTLLSGLVEWAASKEEVRLLVLGLDGAGNTTLLHAAQAPARRATGSGDGGPPKTRPTVGLNVGKLEAGGVAVMLWDLGGGAGLRVIWDR